MSDEELSHEAEHDPEGLSDQHEGEESSEPRMAASSTADADEDQIEDGIDEGPVDSEQRDDRPNGGESGEPMTFSKENKRTLGRLTLHFESRDVDLYVDGDAALRVMTAHQLRTHRGLDDLLVPVISSAKNAWVTLDADEPLAMSWMPGLPRPRSRMAIDPSAPVCTA